MVKYINNTTAQAMINGFKSKFGNNSALKTTSKNFVGAINELKLAIANLPQPQPDVDHVASYPINIVETPYNGLLDTNLSGYNINSSYAKLNSGRIVTGYGARYDINHSYTDDNGATWNTPNTSEITDFNKWIRHNIQVDSQGNIYTKYARWSSDSDGALCVSTDNGESYHKLTYDGHTFVDIAVDNVNNKLYGFMYTGTADDYVLVISSDGGTTWYEPSNNSIPYAVQWNLYTTDTNNVFLRISTSSNKKWILITDNFTKCITIPASIWRTDDEYNNFFFIDSTHFLCTRKTTTGQVDYIGVCITTYEIKQDDTIEQVSNKRIFYGTSNAHEAVQKIIKHNNKYISIGYYIHTSTDGMIWTEIADFTDINSMLLPDNVFDNIMLVPYVDTDTNDIRCKCSNDYGETWNDSILIKSNEKTFMITGSGYGYIYNDNIVYTEIADTTLGQRPNFIQYRFYKDSNSNKIIFGNRYGPLNGPSGSAYYSNYNSVRRFFGYKYTINNGISWQSTGDTQSVYVNGTQSNSDKVAVVKLKFIEHESNGTTREDGSIYQAYQTESCVIDMSN